MNLFCIYARAANGTIGEGGRLPWHLPADLKRFKALTMGKPMIMGRKTFESLPGLLPGRRHIVLTRQECWNAPGAEMVRSVEGAIDMAKATGVTEVAIIGGAAIFNVFLPHAARVELTQIHRDFDGDVFMPSPDPEWTITMREDFKQEGMLPAYSFLTYKRIDEPARGFA